MDKGGKKGAPAPHGTGEDIIMASSNNLELPA